MPEQDSPATTTAAAVIPAPTPEPILEPWPAYCHYPGCRPGAKVFARLVFKSKSGLEWSQGSCQGHQEASADLVRSSGGELLSVDVLEGAD